MENAQLPIDIFFMAATYPFLRLPCLIDARVANETPVNAAASILAGCPGSLSLPNTRGQDALTTGRKMRALQNTARFFCPYGTQ
jgi:hypothetical protein